MNFLSNHELKALQQRGIATPAYDRAATHTGIVHFGPGAFHRVHQADYFDAALQDDLRWGICGVSLHSSDVRDALKAQDHLYTLAQLDADSSFRINGAIREMLVAPEAPATVIERIAAPHVHLLTMTVTEKGYCLTPDGHLDDANRGIQHDLQNPGTPITLIGYLAAGLRARFVAGIAAPTLLSCDNLTDNGARLRTALTEFAAGGDSAFSRWLADVAFPKTMVDSITPATDEALRVRVADALGVKDRWPVQRESFRQWIIEDDFRGPAPDWAAIGVTLTNDVAGHERAKLRLLNGAHTSLAYLGLLAGYENVAQAMDDATLSAFIHELMLEGIAPTVDAPRGLDVPAYINAILQRFRNPAIRHLLSQIAWDGSQKLPFRLLGTIADNLRAGRPIDRQCFTLAAWFQFIRRKALRDESLTDPAASELLQIAQQCNGYAVHDVALFMNGSAIFPSDLLNAGAVHRGIERAYARLDPVRDTATLRTALT